MYTVITLGETMLRLTPPEQQRIEQASSFGATVGGSESNVAIGLARLGLPTCWLSRLPHTPLGRLVAHTIAAHGVDTSHVVWANAGRLGLYFYEACQPPRNSRVFYDRTGSTMSLMQPSDLPLDLFAAGQAQLLHLTGITPAIGPAAAATAQHALDLARAAGWLVSFDLNYRAALWSPAAARAGCAPFLAAANLIFAPLADVARLYGGTESDPEAALGLLGDQAPQATIVLTLSARGAMARAPGGVPVAQAAFPTEAYIGRIGRGDAFVSGFLYGYLTAEDSNKSLQRALAWGVAVAALKATIPGDAPLVERAEVEELLARRGDSPHLSR